MTAREARATRQGQPFGVAHFHRQHEVRRLRTQLRQRRQRGQHGGQAADPVRHARQHCQCQRAQLEHQRAGLLAQALQRGLDEELVKMTTYQQAYAAASRMIQAARDLFDITLNMV